MAEQESGQDPVVQPEPVGAALAHARQALGLKIEDVSVALKLTAARVAALESEQFSSVGAAIYVRGFVRSYARLVGLPERGFDAQVQQYFDQLEPELVPSHGTRRTVSWGERYSGAFSYLVGTALVLTLIWTVIGFDSDSQRRGRAAEVVAAPTDTPSAEQMAATAGESDQVFTAGLEPVDGADVRMAGPVGLQDDPGAAQPPVLASLAPFRDDELSADRGFTLSLSGQSWTEVTDATGARVAYGTLNVGAHRVEGLAPFTVLLGNAGAAQLSAAGQVIDVTPFMRANVARFKLEASAGTLQAAVAAPR